jgi:multicomponent Na+:H+ antiporter subunit B
MSVLGIVIDVASTTAHEARDADLLALNITLLGLLLVIGVGMIVQRSLFVIVMLSGAYSLASAAFFVVMDAVDVAFTEAAVGAGISTVLMLGAMLLTSREARKTPPGRRWAPALAVVATGALLVYASKDMPAFADPESPANAYLGRTYLVRTPIEIGAPNVVTAVLASYRGYDTFGETVVIFTAGVGVMLLLGLRNSGGGRSGEGRGRALRPTVKDGASVAGGEKTPASGRRRRKAS